MIEVTYAVVHKDKPYKVIRRFKERAEANYFLTDCFGPESSQYTVINIMKSAQGVGLTIEDLK